MKAPIETFLTAYENPIAFFEYDHICDVCGGEMLFDINQANDKNTLKCEDCGYTKDWEE
jgi:predicted RNA-binding Zn-ribbon protein involved in translation (DUF1610 family)